MRLSNATLPLLDRGAAKRFDYARTEQAIGIVHFGIGAFHRAHQAWYTDRAMDAGDRNWAIAGVSLRSGDVAAQLNPQDGLYTVAEASGQDVHYRVVGSLRDVTVASRAREQAIGLLAAAPTRIATFTITEKGYCRAPDGSLDFDQAETSGLYSILAEGLHGRFAAGLSGLTLLSCDNLSQNGRVLERLMLQYLDRYDPVLRRWVEAECAFPSSMVDRIVPASSGESIAQAQRDLRMEDRANVVTEPFSQWVIEDRFVGDRPRWHAVGARIVDSVEPYELAKLRMLNGAHSAIAYLGLDRGHVFVHEAVADEVIGRLIDRLMRVEAAASFEPAPGQDLAAYADELIERFHNASLKHRLSQIAMDGSQKIAQRWLQTLADQQAAGRECPAILAALGTWLRYCRGDRFKVEDPLAPELTAIWREEKDCAKVAQSLLGRDGLLHSPWQPDGDSLRKLCGTQDGIVR